MPRRYVQAEVVEVVGAVDALTIEAAAVPVDEVWAIIAAHIEHNDAAAQNLWIEIRDRTGVSGVAVVSKIRDGSAQNVPVHVDRALYMGPRQVLTGRAAGLTAGTRILMRFERIRLAVGEVIPGVPG